MQTNRYTREINNNTNETHTGARLHCLGRCPDSAKLIAIRTLNRPSTTTSTRAHWGSWACGGCQQWCSTASRLSCRDAPTTACNRGRHEDGGGRATSCRGDSDDDDADDHHDDGKSRGGLAPHGQKTLSNALRLATVCGPGGSAADRPWCPVLGRATTFDGRCHVHE